MWLKYTKKEVKIVSSRRLSPSLNIIIFKVALPFEEILYPPLKCELIYYVLYKYNEKKTMIGL